MIVLIMVWLIKFSTCWVSRMQSYTPALSIFCHLLYPEMWFLWTRILDALRLIRFLWKKYIPKSEYLGYAGVNLSLLSKVMSSRLARGTYNGGLLSTEAGTLARVVADGTITLTGYLGESKLLNVTMLPTLFIGLLSIAGTAYTYNSMF